MAPLGVGSELARRLLQRVGNRAGQAYVTSELRDAWYRTLPGRPDQKGPRENHLKVVVFPCCDLGQGVRHNTDDLPAFEYDWLARTFGRWVSPPTNLWYLQLPQEEIPVVDQ